MISLDLLYIIASSYSDHMFKERLCHEKVEGFKVIHGVWTVWICLEIH